MALERAHKIAERLQYELRQEAFYREQLVLATSIRAARELAEGYVRTHLNIKALRGTLAYESDLWEPKIEDLLDG